MQKKLKLILFLFIFCNINIFSQFGGGSGTKADPYKIYTKKQLYFITETLFGTKYSNWTNGKYFILMNDIKDIDKSITSMNGEWYDFQGSFDGQGHKLTLAMDNDAGLFTSVAGTNVEIKNLIVDGYVKGDMSSICGIVTRVISVMRTHTNVTIKNCINMATILPLGYYWGLRHCSGILGTIVTIHNDISTTVTIENCINMGTIASPKILYAAGIIGCFIDNFPVLHLTIKNCINAGTIYGENIGGIVSHMNKNYNNNENIIITNCINTGTLVGKNVNGIVCMENDD